MRVQVIRIKDLPLDLLSKVEKGTPLSWWAVICSNTVQSVWRTEEAAIKDAEGIEGWLK